MHVHVAVGHITPDHLPIEYLAPETLSAILAQRTCSGQLVASCQGDIFSLGALLKALLFRPIMSNGLAPLAHPRQGARPHLNTKVS